MGSKEKAQRKKDSRRQYASQTHPRSPGPLPDYQRYPYKTEDDKQDPDCKEKDGQQAEQTETGKVNLDTAAKEQLMTLTGIGEAKAIAIIAYREEKGKFQKLEDLMNIPGIKEGVFDKIKSQICV